eukprot:1373913-Pyramimonas_sp.AAC.1
MAKHAACSTALWRRAVVARLRKSLTAEDECHATRTSSLPPPQIAAHRNRPSSAAARASMVSPLVNCHWYAVMTPSQSDSY